jgi:HK97 gp10 family phage protein
VKYGRESSATSKVSIHIEGATTAVQSLKELEFNARRRVVSAAVRASNAVIVREAKKLAPTDTGLLQRSIRGTVKMDRVSGRVYGYVRAKRSAGQKKKAKEGDKNPARYAHLVIGGTKAHEIKRDKGGLAIGTGFYTRVWHPGIKPRPFMEQAASNAFQEAISDFSEKFQEALTKETTKIYNANRAKVAALSAIAERF